MAKKFQITQKVTVNGKSLSIPFQMFGEADDVSAIGALLAGGYEVKEVNDALSDTTGVDTNNATTNPVSAIFLNGPKNQMMSIRPYEGSIHFKNTASVDDIAAALRTTKPFELLPSETPTKITVKRSETYAGTSEG
ncbi:hypothetical protein [Arcobacter sp. F2176]|uniref:hypothetical protein n=1 Tax=Arcobacter sp. F2176 TaxID=2044511 RepID=UPI00100A2776|nr:hypothetical protein [Arcobacter sp. F2176]RXJ82650.1 hypothetical protein CRU95_00875 [Arcobacter sp. F2176]